MELIDRYLNAVRRALPESQQNDIIAEISEDLYSQVEEREAEMGRGLTDDEVVEILKKRGHPMAVASRYYPHKHLIGPSFYPVYTSVLKTVFLWLLTPAFLLIGGPIVAFTSQHPARDLFKMLFNLPQVALTTFAMITLVFAFLEHFGSQVKSSQKDRWDPRQLPKVTSDGGGERVSRASAVSDLITGVVGAGAWLFVMSVAPAIYFGALRVELLPAWQSFYWPLLVTASLPLLSGYVGLLRPWNPQLRSYIRLAGYTGSAILCAVLLGAGSWLEVTLGEADLSYWSNIGMQIGLAMTVIISVFEGCREVFRIWKRNRGIAQAAVMMK